MINYTEKIPNNVDLGRDRVLQRALEHWQPAYMGWWYDMGPNESHNYEVYLRTAISVEPDGWAQFGYVKMPIPLGDFPAAARREARSEFRDSQRTAGLAGSARRIPLDLTPCDRYAGRYGTGFRGTTTDAGGKLSLDVRPAEHFPGKRRRRAPPVGHGVLAASLLWA